LGLVKQSASSFFERLVVELLVKMGYGGSRRDAARAVGQVGDEGIDGIIDEDRLGLDTIYIQAKKWDNVVGRPEIQKFVGALMGKRAKKGIFITTSSFSAEATAYVSSIDAKIVLIDGKRLAELMIDYDVGVTPVTTYQLKRVDSDYFGNG
jgi:restriction system protein